MDASYNSVETRPSSYTREDLKEFDVNTYYKSLVTNFPTLMHALGGTVMSHQGPEGMQVGAIQPFVKAKYIRGL